MKRQNMSEVLKFLVYKQFRAGEGENYLVPLLVGPTQAGKTSLVRELASSMGLGLIVLLAQAEDPAELLGLGKVVDTESGPLLTRLLPAWAEDLARNNGGRKWLIFLDEIDKAPGDVHAGLLTLLRNRRVVNRPLHNVAFIAAANDIDSADWPPELRARFRVFSFGYDWDWEIEKHEYPAWFASILRERVSSASLPPPDQAGDTPTTWFNLFSELGLLTTVGADVQKELVFSLFPCNSVAEFVLARLASSRVTLRLEDLLDPQTVMATVKRLREGLISPDVLGDDVVKALAHLLRADASDEERKAGTHLYCALWVACLERIDDPKTLEDVSGTPLGRYVALFANEAPQLLPGTRVDVEIMQSYAEAVAKAASKIAQLQGGVQE